MGKKKPARKNRYKKRVKQKRKRLAGRIMAGAKLLSLMVVMLVTSALFMVVYAAVTQTNYFRTESIQIQGQSRLSQQEVLKQAGINPGDNLLAVNLRLVRKRLMAHPWVVEASVAREIPGTIRIRIKEHRALAVVDLGRKFIVNHNGRIFKEHGSKDPQRLPLVTGVTYSDISLGDDLLTPIMQTVVDLLKLSKAEKSIVPYDQIRKLHMDAEMGVTLRVWKSGRRIKLGLSRYEYKYQQLKKLLPHLKYNRKWQKYRSIDLSNPDRIVVQL